MRGRKYRASFVALSLSLLPWIAWSEEGGSPATPSSADESAAITGPVPLSHTDAVYPEAMRESGQHATVVLSVLVGTDGRVGSVQVLESGGELFDRAAEAAANRWMFSPARHADHVLTSRIRLVFHFSPPSEALGYGGGAAALSEPHTTLASSARPHELQEIVVKGVAPVVVSASDFSLDPGRLAVAPVSAGDLLKFAPGVFATNEGGEGHADHLYLRGMDAKEGEGFAVSLQGMPLNEPGNPHTHGYADTQVVLPELVESLHVIEGPFDPHQGNFALAGSADYRLGLAQRGFSARATRGSFDTNRFVLLWGPPGEGAHTFAGAELFESSGFGARRASQRGTAMAQYEGQWGEHTTWRVLASTYANRFENPGLVSCEDWAEGRDNALKLSTPNLTGLSMRSSAMAEVVSQQDNVTWRDQLFVSNRTFRMQEAGCACHGTQDFAQDFVFDAFTLGGQGGGRTTWHAGGLDQELEVGYTARLDRTAEGIRGQTHFGDIALYNDMALRPFSWMKLTGGVRAALFFVDRVQGVPKEAHTHGEGQAGQEQPPSGVHDKPSLLTTQAETKLLPRIGLHLSPWDSTTYSLNYGRGVRTLAPYSLEKLLQQGKSSDARSMVAGIEMLEGGVSYTKKLGRWKSTARSSLFWSVLSKDTLWDIHTMRPEVTGPTTRLGWMGSWLLVGPWLDQSASLTTVRARFQESHAPFPAPSLVFRSDTLLHQDLWTLGGNSVRGGLGASLSLVGERPISSSPLSTTPAVFLVDSAATLSWRDYELGLRVTNLLDSPYRLGDYVSEDEGRRLSIGRPRTFLGTFAIHWGGS